MRVTLNKVNAEIAKRGGKAQLIHNRAQEYFYFINVGKGEVPSESITVSRLNVYTLEQWISEWERVEKIEANR